MTVRKKTRSNRRNAGFSTGPKTPEGKDRSRRNSFKNGVTNALKHLPGEEVLRLARRLAGPDANPIEFEAAQRVAKSHFEAECIRRHRIELMKCGMVDPTAYPQYAPPKHRPSQPPTTAFKQEMRDENLQLLAELEFRFPEPDQREGLIYGLLHAIEVLKTIDRYEDRAVATRNLALGTIANNGRNE